MTYIDLTRLSRRVFIGILSCIFTFFSAARQGQHQKLGWPNSPYAVSKVGMAAFTGVLQRELDAEDRKVIVNCVHPGQVKTELSKFRGHLTPQQGIDPLSFLHRNISSNVNEIDKNI
jgi:NAD(P)-dependent dehydrogenase (short-subunit alcohol dehydrogenase family)